MRSMSFAPAPDLVPRLHRRAQLAATALCLAAGLSACVQGSDTCPGFNAPEASRWASTQMGTPLRFSSATGEVWTFELTSVQADAAGVSASSESGVGGACAPSEVLRYRRLGSDVRVRIVFQQYLPDAPTASPPSIDMRIDARGEQDTTMPFVDWNFVIDPLTSPLNQSGGRRYDVSRTVGGAVYQDVLEDRLDRANELYGNTPAVPDAAWVRTIVARDIGLLQFELQDGRVFTRVR